MAMLLLLVFVQTILSRQGDLAETQWRMQAEHIAEKLAKEINAVYLAGENASKNVTLPERLRGGKNYTIEIRGSPEPGAVLILIPFTGKGEEETLYYSQRLITGNINGTPLTLSPHANIYIHRYNNTIYFANPEGS